MDKNFNEATKKRKWTQPTLAHALGVQELRPTRRTLRGSPRPTENPVVVELFCGLGGWTEGCRRARLQTVLAIDCNMALLRLHKANHPRCTQVLLVLEMYCSDLRLPCEYTGTHAARRYCLYLRCTART